MVAVVGLCLGTPANAGEGLISELKVGALAHDVPGLWSGFQVEQRTVDLNLEVVFHPLLSSTTSSLKPALGATINPLGETSHLYADLLWELRFDPRWYLTFGIGAAFNNGNVDASDPGRKWLGSHVLFHPTAEIGVNLDAHNTLSVYFEHMSNANIFQVNEGMDDIGVRYGWRF
jgi:hypothetical protein